MRAEGHVGRLAAIDRHVAKINSGNPHLVKAGERGLKAMNLSWGEHSHVNAKLNKMYPAPKPLNLKHEHGSGFGTVENIGKGLLHVAQEALPSKQDIQHPLRFNSKSAKQQWGTLVTHPVREVQQTRRGKYGKDAQGALNAVDQTTGFSAIKNIGHDPLGGGLALAGILPFGKAAELGRLGDAAKAGEAADKAAQAAQDASGLRKMALQRRARRLGRRAAPIKDEAARHARLTELANQAMEDSNVRDRVASFRHEASVRIFEPGHVSPETGGVFGQIIRHGISPNFKGMGKFEKIGAKLDNPGAAELRKQQDELRHEALVEKSGKLRRAQAGANTWDELLGAGSSRRGALPSVGFNGFNDLHPHMEDVRAFVQNLPMYPFDRQRLAEGIDAALHGHLPTESEQRLMEKAFGRERTTTAAIVKSGGKKEMARQIASIPRAMKSAGDLSWGFRQGLTAAMYAPKTFAKTFKGMFKPAASEAEAQARMAELANHPYFPLLVKMGVPFTELGSAEHGVANIANKEEAIMSNYAEHLHEMPVIRNVPGVRTAAKAVSKGVRISDRGYVVPLNEIRFALGSQLLHQALENGWNVEGKLGKDLGNLVGALTGRGNLGAYLTKHRATFNSLFFSPGLMKARFDMLNPVWYARMEPFARAEALKAAGRLSTTLFLVLFAAKMAGARVTMDPRNPDFGKIRIGNTRIDVAGGYSQYLTLYSRIATQTSISSTSGKKTKLSGKAFGASDWDVVTNFFANKLSPVASEAVTISKRNRFGQPLTPTGELGQMFSPLLWNDMYQLSRAKGPGGGPDMAAATFLPDLFGVGVNNYPAPAGSSVPTTHGVQVGPKSSLNTGSSGSVKTGFGGG